MSPCSATMLARSLKISLTSISVPSISWISRSRSAMIWSLNWSSFCTDSKRASRSRSRSPTRMSASLSPTSDAVNEADGASESVAFFCACVSASLSHARARS
eukprot:Amastigsp_a846869_228.p3 type:complete len:102 gc:universal Amastigsp_a846869_228:209-514(+)